MTNLMGPTRYTIEGDGAEIFAITIDWARQTIALAGCAGDAKNSLSIEDAKALHESNRKEGRRTVVCVVWPENADGFPQVEMRELEEIEREINQ